MAGRRTKKPPAQRPKLRKKPSHPAFGVALPELGDSKLAGRLFVVEGQDGSGRSTHIRLVSEWLESNGYAVKHMGLRRSPLLAEDIEQAKQTNILTQTTMSLFYATDFFDQLVHEIIPALRAGYIVLADRYIYTLMARDLVRGASPEWTSNLYSPALVPDAVFYLQVKPRKLALRTFEKGATLDFWESGMDLGLSRDMYESFLKYQAMMQRQYSQMQRRYGFQIIDANRGVTSVQRDLRDGIGPLLKVKS